MEYKLNKREIDLISASIKNYINYLEGLILLLEFKDEKAKLKKFDIENELHELRVLQAKTTYMGQDPLFK